MKKVQWKLQGMLPIGDKDGPIYKWTADVEGERVEKIVPMKARPAFYTREGRFPTLTAALKSIR